MRTLTSAIAVVALTPLFAAVPVITAPAAAPRPVAPEIETLQLRGVDRGSLAALPPDGRAKLLAGRAGSAAKAPAGAPADADAAAKAAPAAPRTLAVLTPQRRTQPFSLVGVLWRPSVVQRRPAVQVRVRENGAWGPWTKLAEQDGGPDAGTEEARRAAGRVGTEPLLTAAGADGVQVRVDTPSGKPPAGLRVMLVDPGDSPADAALEGPTPPAASAAANASRPRIISRSQWGADERLRNGEPLRNDRVKALFLHHTATSSSYSSSGSAAQVRAVYAYHTNGHGWTDIGYNFLVDKWGRIFEGRHGSTAGAVMGAHTGGFNTDSMGIAALGNYDVTRAPASMVSGIARIMAWNASRFYIRPQTKTVLTSSGGGTSKYRAGTRVTFNTISGHRDAGHTACPGRYLYPLLPSIRSKIISLMGADIFTYGLSTTSADWGSGRYLLAKAYFVHAMSWRITIYDGCTADRIRTKAGYGSSMRYAWNLKDSHGRAVRPGSYTLLVTTYASGDHGGPATMRAKVLPTADSPPGCRSGADSTAPDGAPAEPDDATAEPDPTVAPDGAPAEADPTVAPDGAAAGGGGAVLGSALQPAGAPARAASDSVREFTFNGSGFGHGVGMSQYGAYAMARRGHGPATIARWYYRGASISKVGDTAKVRVNLLHRARYAALSVRPQPGETSPWVRMNVWYSPTRAVRFSPGQRAQLQPNSAGGLDVLRNGSLAARIPAGRTARVTWTGTTAWRGAAGLAQLTGTGSYGRKSGKQYRYGELAVLRSGSRVEVVATLRLRDQYLRGVAEMPASWGVNGRAALQAQALAARTYAWRKLRAGLRSDCSCHLFDSTVDQVYAGYQQHSGTYGRYWVAAAHATRGLIITYRGAPAEALYFSSSGGRTENSEDVFTAAVPYLRSVSDPYSLDQIARNPYASWSRAVPASTVAKAFGLPDVRRIAIRSRTAGGSADLVTAVSSGGGSAALTGSQLRRALALPSADVSSIRAG